MISCSTLITSNFNIFAERLLLRMFQGVDFTCGSFSGFCPQSRFLKILVKAKLTQVFEKIIVYKKSFTLYKVPDLIYIFYELQSSV